MTWKLFESFIQDKRYLRNLSNKTLKSYHEVYARWEKYAGGGLPTKEKLHQFVIGMRKGDLSVTTCNISIRSFNSYLSWLYVKGHIQEPLRLVKLKEEKKTMVTFSDEQLEKFLNQNPKKEHEWRFYAMFCTLADTGIRMTECLTIKTEDVWFDDLLIKVLGKGDKERIVPMSLELLRKILWLYSTKHSKPHVHSDVFFCTRNGTTVTYFNFYKVFHQVCEDAGNRVSLGLLMALPGIGLLVWGMLSPAGWAGKPGKPPAWLVSSTYYTACVVLIWVGARLIFKLLQNLTSRVWRAVRFSLDAVSGIMICGCLGSAVASLATMLILSVFGVEKPSDAQVIPFSICGAILGAILGGLIAYGVNFGKPQS